MQDLRRHCMMQLQLRSTKDKSCRLHGGHGLQLRLDHFGLLLHDADLVCVFADEAPIFLILSCAFYEVHESWAVFDLSKRACLCNLAYTKDTDWELVLDVTMSACQSCHSVIQLVFLRYSASDLLQ